MLFLYNTIQVTLKKKHVVAGKSFGTAYSQTHSPVHKALDSRLLRGAASGIPDRSVLLFSTNLQASRSFGSVRHVLAPKRGGPRPPGRWTASRLLAYPRSGRRNLHGLRRSLWPLDPLRSKGITGGGVRGCFLPHDSNIAWRYPVGCRRGGKADAEDLKSSGGLPPCGFDSHRRHSGRGRNAVAIHRPSHQGSKPNDVHVKSSCGRGIDA
jgi:hypothetical protein